MFEVALLQIRFGAYLFEHGIGIVHPTVETVGIFMLPEQVLFDALATGFV